MSHRIAIACVPFVLLACSSGGVPTEPQGGNDLSPGGDKDLTIREPPIDLAAASTQTVTYKARSGAKVDLLFMVDNSYGMDAMQTELKSRLPSLLKPFQDLADKGTYPDLQIGVVTSDYGAGATGAPGCTPSGLTGGGDQGKLQAIGKKASANCQKPTAANFVKYRFTPGPPVHNLPQGQGLVDTLGCMMSVGSNGCGFEHQLESVYAALHNNIADNAGFLRDGAALVVVFFTNEDDASAPPDTDVFDKNKVAQYGYEHSYSRQTRFGVMCGQPSVFPPYGDSGGPLAMCTGAPNPDGISGPGKLYDVTRYIDFFTLPRVQGGVKDDPLDVTLIAIDAPEQPFEVLLANPGTPLGQPLVHCGPLNEASNPPCVPVLQHSCVNPQNKLLFGDPPVRLNQVVRSVARGLVSSICDGDYTPALESAAGKLAFSAPRMCLPKPLPHDANGPVVECEVSAVTVLGDGSRKRMALPHCTAHGLNPPCWWSTVALECQGTSPDSTLLAVELGSPALAYDEIEAVCGAQ